MTTNAIVPASQIENLPAEVREQAVTMYLASARDRLAEALEATGPHAVAGIKAEVATVAEMTKQLGLSRECRDDATEMVRRAEFAFKKAIRKGQEEGAIETMEEARRRATATREVNQGRSDRDSLGTLIKPKPTDFATHSELYGVGKGIMQLEATDEEFEGALGDARAEGNLSRANVVRKIRQQASPQTRDQRADQIEQLAQQGYTSHQIAPKVGVSDIRVRHIARDYGIDIPADRAVGKRQRLNANRILSGAAESVSAAAYSLQQINPLDLDKDEAREWVDSLTESLTALRKALNPIKESLQ